MMVVCSIQQYEVEKSLDKETGRWSMRLEKFTGEKPEMDVTGLYIHLKRIPFRVSAINEEEDEPGKPGVPDFVDWDNTGVDLGSGSLQRVMEVLQSLKYIIEKKEKFYDMGESRRSGSGDSQRLKVNRKQTKRPSIGRLDVHKEGCVIEMGRLEDDGGLSN
ncbi:hypothetical protein AVEN_28898-1 [Araneus ventricosus]|uniref:Uncharacterized protein n=1 Tax=Araneus ventricosus TaxID=182803 RepID=A0A4Y2AJ61_ARAVE|nr:hypothetical protein AVEN_28898-1 [Araneus ventricosus]